MAQVEDTPTTTASPQGGTTAESMMDAAQSGGDTPSGIAAAATAAAASVSQDATDTGRRVPLSDVQMPASPSKGNISPRPENTPESHPSSSIQNAEPKASETTANAASVASMSESETAETKSPVSSNLLGLPSEATEPKTCQCRECGEEYTDVESYMNHQCFQTQLQSHEHLPEGTSEEALSDVESFEGKIVYNPDGSAYIIEGETDLSETESLLDLPKTEGTIVDQRGKAITSQIPSYPQVANAFYIHRNPAAFYNSFWYPPESRPRVEAPIMHAYRVYDVRSGKLSESNKENENKTDSTQAPKLNIPHVDAATVPTKPILMCFICKLSFGFAKSFVAHALGEHNMTLNDAEKEIIGRRNSSAIIQGVGKDKDPLMSFLEPTRGPKTNHLAPRSSDSSVAPRTGLPQTLYNSHGGNNTNVSYVYSSSKVTPMEQSSKSNGGSDDDTSIGPDTLSGDNQSPQADGLDSQSKAKGGSPTVTSTPSRTSRLDNGVPAMPLYEKDMDRDDESDDDDNALHIAARSPRSEAESEAGASTGTVSPRVQHPNLPHALGGLSTAASSMAMPSLAGAQMVAGTTTSSHPGVSPPHSSSPTTASGGQVPASHHSQGIVIRVGCEDHPQGNISGVECSKCDMLLGSQRAMGGHMTMMHSRNSCKTLKCPKCNWHYKYQETLEIHMKEKHPENDAQCVYCISNQAHPRLARGEAYTCGYKPYRCEVCNYSTTTKGNLSIHMQSDKHINNMQELQNGTCTPEIKMPPAPPITSTPESNSQIIKKNTNKPKPTWRCDVCNYETNVARNLRIHMTSEKHTHNMMVLQQNVKHMQRDMQFQLNQMAVMGQDPNVVLGLPPMPPGMPPFTPYDPAMFMVAPPGMMETPVDLTTQENGLGKAAMPIDMKNNNNEPSKIFQCGVCNIYSADSVDALHQHMQLDRSKHGDQDNISVIGGTYMCNLCQYKTNLKANFQLHCKTDKHLQRLMLVNHIREGGPSNEWRLKYMNMSNPIQVRCGACDYYTNSIHKLQLHLSTPRHESNAKVFQHLQRCESKVPTEKKYYHCTICNFSSKIKLNLIQHVHAMKHMHNESIHLLQLKEQGKEHEYNMQNVFVVKEYTEGSHIIFDEADGENLGQSRVPASSSSSASAANSHVVQPAVSSQMVGTVPNHNSGAAEVTEGAHLCPFCNYANSNLMRLEAHVRSQHSQGSLGSALAGPSLLCPLCQEKCRGKPQLEKHLVEVHSVTREGLQRLMVMVETPTTWSPPTLTQSQATTATPLMAVSNPVVSTPVAVREPTGTSAESSTATSASITRTAAPLTPTPATTLSNSRGSPRPGTPGAASTQSDEPTDPADLKAEILETQALKLAEEASMDGVVLSDKDGDDQYRCQTCSKTFQNIDGLYAHQNELGHLELKQTPRGPGYLCWKKGCNQYFKTASALQIHFREIHAKCGVSISEKHIYKYRCNECSLAFKTLEKLQMHSFYHIIRAATKCSICGRSFRSVMAMRKHVEGTHLESMSQAEIEQYKASLAATAPLALLDIPGAESPSFTTAQHSDIGEAMLDTSTADRENNSESGQMDVDDDIANSESKLNMNEDTSDSMDRSQVNSETDSQGEGSTYREEQFLEDYINSQAMAENSYNDPSRKYKCHRCKVAFTKQNYLSAHNKTLLHRKGDKLSYPMEKYLDPNRPFKCDVCKESFTQKNILLVHYNSVSHLHKLKQAAQDGSGADALTADTTAKMSVAPIVTPSTSPDVEKPYKCNICKVAYKESSTLDIHIRSVFHQTRASKLPELAATGQVDVQQPLIEQPEPLAAKSPASQEQQKKILTEMLQQRPSSMPVSTTTSSSLGESSDVTATTASATVQKSEAVSTAVTRLSAGGPSPASTPLSLKLPPASSSQSSLPVSSTQAITGKDQSMAAPNQVQNSQQPVYACSRCNNLFGSQETLQQHQQMFCLMPSGIQRGMPRFKPHIQRNLLENIGFECVMQFNEFDQRFKRDDKDASDSGDSKMEANETAHKDAEEKPDTIKDDIKQEKLETIGEKNEAQTKSLDIPELNKCQCRNCGKQFSSIWVLKAHQEEVHRDIVPIDYVEKFSKKFKEEYEKKQEKLQVEQPPVQEMSKLESAGEKFPLPSPSTEDKSASAPLLAPGLGADLSAAQAAAQMMQIPLFNMMPMGMNMPLGMNMTPSLMPMMMPMGPEMFGLPSMPMLEPSFLLAQQQQQQQQQQQAAAALAAQQNKRARTRINDEQLKILRRYFDINNSPSEEHIMKMSEEASLPAKVIKHWFRNTLFKERQRNKDSPYNFSVPPSTTLNLEEYEKTGKIPVTAECESEKAHDNLNTFYREQRDQDRQRQMEGQRHGDTQDRESVVSAGESSTISSTSSTPGPVVPASTQAASLASQQSTTSSAAAASVAPTSSLSLMSPGPTIVSPRKLGLSPFSHTSPTDAQTSPQGSFPGRRANRTRFTDYQIKCLQDYFEQNAYPKDDDLDHLSKMLNLSPRVIVVWFQNARQKARKNYENQPALDMSEDGNRFTRTPGLNYQCKKCFTVFQRYFELIKHQRTQCYKDDPRSVNTSLGSPPSDSNSSNASMQGFGPPNQAEEKADKQEMQAERDKAPASAAVRGKDEQCSPSKSHDPEYKCEKCNLVFPRFDLWQEHQNVHSMNPNLFSPFTPNSAFGMLQSIAQQQPQQAHLPQVPPPVRPLDKTPKSEAGDDEDMERDEPQRDKRLRTTILPEQLDYLYQQYQVDCNPSRKQLENISNEVGLKKRVVQVWFQNTRARERKGQYRAHQQLIHKRCPFCKALFRAKSALESHLATKHPEEMAKGDVNVDAIPDASALETSTSSSEPSSSTSLPTPGLDMTRLLNNPYNMPNPFMPMLSPSGLQMPLATIGNDPVQNNMKNLYEESLKKYLNDLSGATHLPKTSGMDLGLKTPSSSASRSQTKVETEDAPLDLSNPIKASTPIEKTPEAQRPRLTHSNLEAHRTQHRAHPVWTGFDLQESRSETHSESLSETNEDKGQSNPPSPTSSTSSQVTSTPSVSKMTPGGQPVVNKRFRTQMSSTQIKVMKNLFQEYKTPTMSECEMLGNMIGLAKRVVQVWFQNARAKEKKLALTYNKPYEADFQRPPEMCKLCNFKYSHKYTIQDHIFTKTHIDRVKTYVQSQAEAEREYTGQTDSTTTPLRDMEQSQKQWGAGADPSLVAHPHLAQLHAMGLQAMGLSGNNAADAKKEHQGEGSSSTTSNYHAKAGNKESKNDTKKSEASVSAPATASSASSLLNPFSSALGLPSPGDMGAAAAAAGMFPLLYPGMGSFLPPGMGMPMLPPGMMPGPEMFMYDPTTFGTPLSLLQIPEQAISDVQGKLQEEGCVRARYTQDCKMISDLRSMISEVDCTHAREAMVDVGYICRKCQMVYPGKDACIAHQQLVCYQGKSGMEARSILKLEQIQYECCLCQIKFSTLEEFKVHCDMDMHKQKATRGKAAPSTPPAAATSPRAIKRELDLTTNNNTADDRSSYQEAKKIKTE